VASYLEEIMVHETHEAYAINPAYTNVSLEESIREGVLAFRAFLVRLYDVLYAKDNMQLKATGKSEFIDLTTYYLYLYGG
jgi:hypothetical protein